MKVRPAYRLRYIPSRYGMPERLRVAGRRRRARVGDRHDEVGGDRVLAGELHAHPAPDLVEVAALHHGVGPGEVDELEDAQGRARRREADGARRDAGLEDHQLARLHVPDVVGADDVEAGRLRREDPARLAVGIVPQAGRVGGGRQPPQDQRAEAVGVAHADDAPLVEDDQAVGAAHARQDPQQRLDGVAPGLVGEERGQELRVRAGRESAAAAREPLQQLARVDQVAVVPDRERPARPEAERRLGVLPHRGARRGVAAMGDRERGPAGSAGAARRAPGRSARGPCRASAGRRPRPRSRPTPGPGAGGRTGPSAASRAASPPGATTPNTPHTGLALHAEGARQAVLPRVAQVREARGRPHRRRGRRVPRRRPWRPPRPAR